MQDSFVPDLAALRAAVEGPERRSYALLVDDTDVVRKIVSIRLKQAGYSVLEASTIEEATAIFNSHPISVVISDLDLGHGPTGAEFLGSLTRSHPAVVCILMSGSFLPEQRWSFPFPMLPKPFDTEQLLALLPRRDVRQLESR